ncbi:MAG: ABC transporter permease [Ktedonobacteraceae bacterium]|nr:ABC transporter permease [Ktedonobacteraceae bacterium]
MNITPQATPVPGSSQTTRTASVILGRQDFVSTVLRLTGMELYKMRRRVMSKVLAVIAIVAIVLVFLAVFLFALFMLNSSGASLLSPACSEVHNRQPCLDHTPSQADLDQAKHQAVVGASQSLRLPTSLNVAVQIALTPFTLLIIILVGAMAGGEYSMGTVRLLSTRGPTRAQFLLAKLATAVTCSALGILGMALLAVLLGAFLNIFLGVDTTLDFLTAAWVGHALLYLLLAILNWTIFGVIAILFGVLGRATVAGIVAGIIWFLLEPVVSQIFSLGGSLFPGAGGTLLKAIPDYLIGNNIEALLQNQGQYIFSGSPAQLSDLHALLVLAVYLAVFIGIAWLVNERRDITN